MFWSLQLPSAVVRRFANFIDLRPCLLSTDLFIRQVTIGYSHLVLLLNAFVLTIQLYFVTFIARQCCYHRIEMAKTEEIRDGLFSISWTVQNLSSTIPSCQVDNLPTFSKSCSLTCKLENNLFILALKTADPPDPLRRVVITASCRSVKRKMKLGKSVWRASWIWNPPTSASYYDGRGNYAGSTGVVSFEILIDLKPACFVSVKEHVLEHLTKLWEHKTGSDVTFNCGGEIIKAHTLILASGSPILAAMFQNDFKESQERVVLIKDIEAKVFENFLRYIYVGECDLLEKGEGSEVADLLVAADKYAVDSLKEECENHLSKIITVETAVQYLELAHLHNAQKLHKSALNFMADNAKAVCSRKDVFMVLMNSYPELCFQFIQLVAGC